MSRTSYITHFHSVPGEDDFILKWDQCVGAVRRGDHINIYLKDGGNMFVCCNWKRFADENAKCVRISNGDEKP